MCIMDLDYRDKDEIIFILENYMKIQIKPQDIQNVKLYFIKNYSVKLVNRIKFLCKIKLFALFNFFNSDNIEYIDEQNGDLTTVDTLRFYFFNYSGERHYLLFSVKYDKQGELKNEKVEMFI